jgi:DNA-binding transcriptional LysR family regulator
MALNGLIHRLPRHLKMSELRVFVAVLEHRSFHKAAAVVNLTQPAITKAIAGLEETLGVRLFDRHAHGVEPTVHGLSFAPRAVAIFDELRRAAQELAVVSSGATGTLRVGAMPMPALPFLPLAIERLADGHPGIFVSVVEAVEPDLLDRLRKQDIELAILRLEILEPAEDLRTVALFEETLCIVAARDHPLAGRKALGWPELLAERWVMPPPEGPFFEHVRRRLDELGLELPRAAVVSSSRHVQFGMVLHGAMLSFALRSQAELSTDRNSVVKLHFALPAAPRTIGAVSLRSRESSPLARELIGYMQAHAAVD